MPATQQQDFTDEIARRQEVGEPAIERDEAITAIRAALKRRTGRTWSVTGGRGTAWGWITVTAPPKRRTGGFEWSEGEGLIHIDRGPSRNTGMLAPDDAFVLAQAMGLERVHEQGISIPAGTDYRVEHVARAEGRSPSAIGRPYWD